MSGNYKSELWDFDENTNYVLINGYKVLKYPDYLKASLLLSKINNLIRRCFESIFNNEMITPEVELLLTTPFYLQEMQLIEYQNNIKFQGLNKPKNVIPTNEIDIGPDKNLRAQYRVIFLTLRKNNKLLPIKFLKNLIAHELAHTALNHVTWRDDDHGGQFKLIYEIIMRNFN
jgi:hypothetical protein